MLILKPRYVGLAVVVALLSACGGGGGGTPTPTSFKEIVVPSTFNWATTVPVGDAKVTVTRASGAPLGTVQVWVSNYQTTDPMDATVTLAEPLRTSLIVSALATNASGVSAQADLGALTFPTTTASVLVEVLDSANTPGGRVAYKIATLAELNAGVSLSIPAP